MTFASLVQDSRIRLLLIAVALPAAIAGIDHWVLLSEYDRDWSQGTQYAIYSLLVGEVALLGLITGRLIDSTTLRWIVYIWTIALVDLLVFVAANSRSATPDPVGYALFSAQIGMLVIWSLLGGVHWACRLPVSLVVAIVLTIQAFSLHTGKYWACILLGQSAATIVMCVVLRCFRVRVDKIPLATPNEWGVQRVPTRQFTLTHMFLWTTATAIILKLLPLVNVPVDRLIESVGLVSTVTLGSGLATISLVAMWSALGNGPILLRLAMPIISAAGVGTASLYICSVIRDRVLAAPIPVTATAASASAFWQYSPTMYWVVKIGDAWIVWCMLSSCFLAAFLIVFRASGYRLVRRTKTAIAVAKSIDFRRPADQSL